MNFLETIPPKIDENTITINAAEVMGDTICITCEDGAKICQKIIETFNKGKKAIVSFKNCEDFTPAFFADAIGHLYAVFPEEQIEKNLTIVDLDPEEADSLAFTVESVKDYLSDPEGWVAAARDAFGSAYFDE